MIWVYFFMFKSFPGLPFGLHLGGIKNLLGIAFRPAEIAPPAHILRASLGESHSRPDTA